MGMVGKKGRGKCRLMKIVMGVEKGERGRVEMGERVGLG